MHSWTRYVLPMTQLLFFGIMAMIAYGFIGRIKGY